MTAPTRWRSIDCFVILAVALPAVPIVVAVIRAIAEGWFPMGDQALMEIRARDVLTAHHPLLGTASSAALGQEDAVLLNHPGPLMFDALALPVRLFGGGPGVAVGVGIANLAAATISVVFAFRRSGRAGAALAALAFAGLGWAAGSESLFDPFNPTAAMLPCLACLFLAWAAVDLDAIAAVPWLLGVATYVVQISNSYLLFLAPMVLAVCAISLVRMWRRRWTGLRAVGIGSVAVVLVLWSQPLVEQILHGRDGNIARMVEASGVLANNPGPSLGTQIAAATLSLPPWWWRSEFEGIQTFSPLPAVSLAVGSLVALVVVCAVGCWWSWRRYVDGAAAMLVVGISVLIAWIAAIRSPVSSFFGVNALYVRWLWPVSVFIWFAVGLTAWRFLAPRLRALVGRRALVIGAAAGIVAVSLANIPRHTVTMQASAELLRPSARRLIDMARANIEAEIVRYRPPPGYDVFGVPLLAQLQSDGVDFLVDDPVLVRQFGERRRYRGEDVAELRVVVAMSAIEAADGGDVVAFVSQLSRRERGELEAMATDVEGWLRDGRIRLSDAGRASRAAGFGEPWFGQLDDPGLDAAQISRSIALANAVTARFLDADPEILAALDRYASMRQAVEMSTVAVVLTPPGQ